MPDASRSGAVPWIHDKHERSHRPYGDGRVLVPVLPFHRPPGRKGKGVLCGV